MLTKTGKIKTIGIILLIFLMSIPLTVFGFNGLGAGEGSYRPIEPLGTENAWKFENDNFIAHIKDGAINYLKNKQTGTEYISNPEPNANVKTSVLFNEGVTHRNPGWQTIQDVIHPENSQVLLDASDFSFMIDEYTVVWQFTRGNQQSQIYFSLDPIKKELIFRMQSRGDRNGMHRVRYALTGIDHNKLDVILPVQGGIRIKPDEQTLQRDYFVWPLRLNAQFVVLQGVNEGFWVRSDDTELVSKGIELDRQSPNNLIALGFDIESQAPFDDKTNLSSVSWKLSTYQGEWTLPVHQYRLWMEENYEIPAKPNWTNSIKLILWYAPVSLQPSTLNALTDLTTLINPQNVLIGTGDWRVNSWAMNYPDYSVHPEWLTYRYQPLVDKGYKVMLWMNPQTTHNSNEAYERFKNWSVRDPITGTVWPNWNPGMTYISLAKDGWRSELVNRIRDAWNAMIPKPSALYLDESLFITQNANGSIDGKTSAQGNLQMHKDFIDNIPVEPEDNNLVLTGEDTNEISFIYETFTQGSVWGGVSFFDESNGIWSFTVPKEVHHLLIPVSTLLFSPYTRIFYYAGTSGINQNATSDALDAFEKLRYEPQINPMPYNRSDNRYYLCDNDDETRGEGAPPLGQCILNEGIQRIIDRANGRIQHPPALTQDKVIQSSDNVSTNFTFSAVYSDEDGEGPGTENYSYVRVVIDGVPYDLNHNLSQINPALYMGGVEFSLQKELNAGRHNYHFEAWDTWKVVRHPNNGELELNVGSVSENQMNCNVKTSCSPDETCIISMLNKLNSHAATCDSNYPYKICCKADAELHTTITTSECDQGSLVFSLYERENSHVSILRDSQETYNNVICLSSTNQIYCHAEDKGLNPQLYGSCDIGNCLATVYKTTNSHVASCEENNRAPISLCCEEIISGTGGNESSYRSSSAYVGSGGGSGSSANRGYGSENGYNKRDMVSEELSQEETLPTKNAFQKINEKFQKVSMAIKDKLEEFKQKAIESKGGQKASFYTSALVGFIILIAIAFFVYKKHHKNKTYRILKNYIEINIKKGYSTTQIKNALLKAGWSDEPIEKEFKKINLKL